MIITASANWSPDPGTVIEWRATRSARDAAAVAHPDEGHPSFLQENHVRAMGARRGGAHHGYLAVATEVDGRLDSTAMATALRAFTRRHAGLRTWLREADGVVTRFRIPSAAVDFEPCEIGATPGGARSREHLLDRCAREATVTSWPGFVVGAIARADCFTLYYACDHALSDGISQALVLPELLELYRAETTGTPARLVPVGGFPDYAEDERRRADEYHRDHPVIREWVDLFTDHGGRMPSCPVDLGLEPGATAPMRPIEFDLLDAPDTDAFAAVCRSAGVRFVAGVLAAVAVADHEIAGRAGYYGMIVTSTRDGEHLAGQGWYCNFAPVAFAIDGNPTFRDLLAAAQAGYDRAQRLTAAPARSVITALLGAGADPTRVAASPHLLSYIDFRRFPGAGTAPYDRGVLFTGEGPTGNASLWINRDHRHLYLGCQSPDTALAQQRLAPYHARLREVFATVARDGDRPIGAREVTGAGHHH
ncbi:condensation domain-containing protein [Nocardia takedensis]|uniref:condensation domain-containing protein n=1 Tax=Nocardia takedensis TaxID=259390 RepID=UPI0002F0E65C|nr:condensation domain-containing protein [Nocardia takedensis]